MIRDILLIGLPASVMGAIIYGILFGQREDRIRAYLKASTKGALRLLYVRALIQAIQGGAEVAKTRSLVALWLLVIAGASVGLTFDAVRLESRWQAVNANLRELADSHSKSALMVRDPESMRKAITTRDPESIREDLKRESDALGKEIDAVTAERRTLEPQVLGWVRFERGLSLAFLFICEAGWLVWFPFAIMRTRFAHEITRFSLRIQGLASRDELARMTEAELSVRNAETLKPYVQILKAIAARHGMPELTRTFELWKD
jgi:hypothetical protein